MIKTQIVFLDNNHKELITIPCEEQGRYLSTCLYLLQAIYDGVSIEPCNVTIASLPAVGESTLIAISNYERLPSGNYQICHTDGAPIVLTWNIRTIVPLGSLGRNLTPQEKTDLGTAVVEESYRSGEMKGRVSQRDQVCLMSGSAKDVTLTRILAHGWHLNTENGINMLPGRIRRLIETVGDSPANGMLLQPNYAAAFEGGYFAIRLNARNQYEVVAITDGYMSHDGFLLYGGSQAGDTALDSIAAMNGELLQFHLRCAVLRNMKASAEPNNLWAQCDDDLEDIASELEKCTNLSTEVIKSGLNWRVVEQVTHTKELTGPFRGPA